MKRIFLLGIGLGVLVLCGCSSVTSTVMPQGNNTYTIMSTGPEEGDTNQAAMKKATEVCQQQGRTPVVIKQDSKYQGGLDRQTKDILNTAASVATSLGKKYVPGASSNDDYKVTLKFRCQ